MSFHLNLNKPLAWQTDMKYLLEDPFDRLLISQALSEGMTLLTVDENIRKYQLAFA